ncbi:hypothetical protein [Novosphingobium mangrovi (ex Huang et al. 2023)]|uniref:Uncharacterized protein n=1 Tax=Novosphingobium mangrovi (ex Huang et al. 2023) TaxID=2976432 RepID=A0ABT2I144_9SPHN|nr:hypothetical protein [Novosphingobium mangrovi (ex Huang et al. 2023)]MCT2398525.1 hypothetical protein [Novosphingobium mangrovi (ex Huang et al. 2023)]
MVTLAGGRGFKGSGAFTGQGFRIAFEREKPGPYEAMRDEGVAIRGASIDAVTKTTEQVKEQIRDYIDAHFGGSDFTSNGRRRVANASAQSVFYDEVDTKGQYAGLVYSKFGKRDKGGFVDYLLLHIRGDTIRPGPGENWLKIENPKAGGLGVAQTGHFPMSGSDIFFLPSKDGKKLFQLRRYRKSSRSADRGKTQLLATLMRKVTVPASLSGIDAIAARRPDMFEGFFARSLKAHRDALEGR